MQSRSREVQMISFFVFSFQKWVFPQKSVTDEHKASVRSADRDAERNLVTSMLKSYNDKHRQETLIV